MNISRRAASYGKAMSEESIPTVDSATPQSLTVPNGVSAAVVSVAGGNARYALLTTPASDVGHLLLEGGQVEVFTDDMSGFQIIAESTSVDVFVTYYG